MSTLLILVSEGFMYETKSFSDYIVLSKHVEQNK